MPNKRASEVWDTLISNSDACTSDREVTDVFGCELKSQF